MVSVIIPVYNGEGYIKTCLDSLFSQVTADFEVIAVNDGSKDGSSALLHEYAAAHANMRVVDKPQNEGLPQAKKSGIAEARGEYVAFLDVDDWVDPNMYTLLAQKAEESHADLVFCDYVEEYPERSVPVHSHFQKGQTFPMSGADAMRYVNRRQAMFPYPWNKLYRTELLRAVEFPTGNFVGEDYYVLRQLLDLAKTVDYVDFTGYHYVLTSNSMSRGGYSANTVLAYNNYEKGYRAILDKHPEQKRDVTHYLITEYMAMIVAMGRNKTYDRDLIRKVKRFVRRGLLGFLFASYVPFTMKGSALALTISYRLLIAMYRLIAK